MNFYHMGGSNDCVSFARTRRSGAGDAHRDPAALFAVIQHREAVQESLSAPRLGLFA